MTKFLTKECKPKWYVHHLVLGFKTWHISSMLFCNVTLQSVVFFFLSFFLFLSKAHLIFWSLCYPSHVIPFTLSVSPSFFLYLSSVLTSRPACVMSYENLSWRGSCLLFLHSVLCDLQYNAVNLKLELQLSSELWALSTMGVILTNLCTPRTYHVGIKCLTTVCWIIKISKSVLIGTKCRVFDIIFQPHKYFKYKKLEISFLSSLPQGIYCCTLRWFAEMQSSKWL